MVSKQFGAQSIGSSYAGNPQITVYALSRAKMQVSPESVSKALQVVPKNSVCGFQSRILIHQTLCARAHQKTTFRLLSDCNLGQKM